MVQRRDVAIVLSGGGVNGVLMELGFLRRVRESELWPRVGLVCGTSAGALAGAMAALDRLDELEDFLLRLQPADTFRPNRLWRLPLLGLHEYVLPQTIAERVADPLAL
jgi:predicted acylesterase/phospholipase RssA